MRKGAFLSVWCSLLCFAAATASVAPSGGWPLLEELVTGAPARQVGQPGNAFVDQWVEQLFQQYVEANGGLDRAGYIAAEAEMDAAIGRVLAAREEIYLKDVSPALFVGDDAEAVSAAERTLWTSVLLHPEPVLVVLAFALVLLVCAYWFQRRKSLLIAGACILVVSVALAFGSWRMRSTGIGEMSTTGINVDQQFNEAATAMLELASAQRKAQEGNWQRGRMRHYTGAFVPGEGWIQAGGAKARIYQLAPNLVEPGNLPGNRLDAPVYYLGDGSFENLRRFDLTGAVAVLEFNSGHEWISAVEAGAVAVIFIEPAGDATLTSYQAYRKVSDTPLSLPRFYLKRDDAVALFGDKFTGAGPVGTAVLTQEPGRWERQAVYTDWIYIPGTDPALAEELVHVQAYKDAASIVPELSPGAESAMNLVAVAELLETLSNTPPPRPVLISVVNDHCNALNGEYVFSSYAFTEVQPLVEEMDHLDYLRSQYVLVERVFSQNINRALLDYLRDSIERVGGRSFTVKESAVNFLTMRRNTLRGEYNHLAFELESKGLSDAEVARIRERMAGIEDEVEEVVRLLGLFNRFGHQTHFTDLDEEGKKSLQRLFERLASDAAKSARLVEDERRMMLNNLLLRTRVAPKLSTESVAGYRSFFEAAFPPVNALAGFNLDLGAGNDELGFFYIGQVRPINPRFRDPEEKANQRSRRLARLTLTVASEMEREDSDFSGFLRDTILGAGGQLWYTHLGTKLAFGSAAFHQFARTGLTLTSVADQHPLLYTPDDTLENLDRQLVEKQLRRTNALLTRLISDPRLSGTVQRRGSPQPLSVELTVRQMDRFSVEIPRTVLADAVVLGFPWVPPLPTEPQVNFGQVRPYPILMSDAAGRLNIRGELWHNASLLAFGFSHDFSAMTAALDFGENESRFISTLNLTKKMFYASRSVVTFEAEKTDIIGFTDPLTLIPLQEVEVLDGRSDSRPRHFSVAGVSSPVVAKQVPYSFDGSASIFVSPGMPFKLRSANVVAINTTPDNLEGVGFPSDSGMIRNLPLVMAYDYQRLSGSRLALLESKGVSSDSAVLFNEEGTAVLEELAETPDPGDRVMLAEIARGLSFQSYQQTVKTIADLVKAVVILLALVVPFCFFLVKLITPFTDINRQILMFMGVFALFAAALYFIQPAFHVGDRPEIVILAFVILGLAAFVGSVILGKFNTAMNQAVEQSQLAESPDAPQGRLAGVAFMVGVNNMKRRRIRTSLTCATIILVTFTILSVISVRQDAEPLRLRVGVEAPYNGLVFVNPGMAAIDSFQLSRLRAHFGDRAETVVRTWTSRQDEFGGYMPFRFVPAQPREDARLKALDVPLLLGVEVGDRDFITVLDSPEYMVGEGRWFSANDAEEVIISRRTAELLGIPVDRYQGEKLILNGRSYEIVALLDDDRLSELRDLRNMPFLPLKMDAAQLAEGDSESSGDITQLPGVSVASTLEVAILPVDTARSLGSTTNRVLSVKYRTPEGASDAETVQQLWNDAQQFLRFQDAYLAVGLTQPVDRGDGRPPLDPGEYVIASSSTAEVGGVLKIAIPVILAATIILNTMLGSVMERKKEISIYNAIGLNPTHVMVFFLAEALVFGLVGSVAGYFIGQGLSVLVSQFVDINLNYSSLSVMVVIFLTISTVMLSTLYPATMAARAAVPSGQRKWSLPRPDGDEISLKFPFSYDPRRILGICAFLNDFMQQNSEASTGKFLARLRAIGRVPSQSVPVDDSLENHSILKPGESLVMVYDVAPIPFDLGVNQKMEIYADYDPRVKAHMLSVHLTRESGDRESWTTVNQPFLEALRKRLLGWRSQRPDVQESYFVAGEKLFEDAGMLPVRDDAGMARQSGGTATG